MRRTPSNRNAALWSLGLTLVLMANLGTAAERPELQLPGGFLGDAEDSVGDFAHYGTVADEGVVEVVRERYPNGEVRVEREVTLDEDGNYVNHGAWKMYAAGGTIVAEGHYNMGQRVGMWARWHNRNESGLFNEFPYNRFKPPFMSQAHFVNGQIDGDWIIVDADQKKVCQISIKNGERHGPAITWLPNGKTYRQATYDGGVPVGDVLEVDSKGNELQRTATYVDGRKIVTRTSHYQRGKQKKMEALFLAAKTVQKSPDNFWNMRFAEYMSEGEDLRHGPAKAWYESGRPQFEGFFQNDKKAGTFTYWHSNGQVSATGEYKDDQPHGMWVWYHENGLKSSVGRYDAGNLIGEWRWWNEEGKLTRHKVYDGSERLSAATPDMFDFGPISSDDETTVR